MDGNQKLNIKLKEIVPEYYSNNPLISGLFHKRQNIAVGYISKINSKKLLDIGCGDGSLIKKIKNTSKDIKLKGIDINPNVLELNEVFRENIFSKQDLTNLSFKRNEFDTIVCLDVLEHIKELDGALKEIKRILASGGYLITSEPTESFFYKFLRFLYKGTYSEKDGPGAGAHYSNAKEIDKILKNNGFRRLRRRKLPFSVLGLDLFHVNLYVQK